MYRAHELVPLNTPCNISSHISQQYETTHTVHPVYSKSIKSIYIIYRTHELVSKQAESISLLLVYEAFTYECMRTEIDSACLDK